MEINRVKEILEVLKNSNFEEVEWQEPDFKIKVKNRLPSSELHINETRQIESSSFTTEKLEPPDINDANEQSNKIVVKSPLVGTFYRSSSPNSKPFVKPGDHVKPGQVLCIVEAMKLMNEIESEISGLIKSILINNAQPVEYGEPLFIIEKN